MAAPQSFMPIQDQTGWRPRTTVSSGAIHSAADLGAALRAQRKALGLTQADLALAAGVGLRFVVELEAGKPTVQMMRVLRVVDALGGTLQLSGMASTDRDDS